ncbi:uncharacterized protein BDZ83DRAFT_635962 [Colletotrichum acutatum]|uniref:Uncharacterized protein n=1 Tax=Glomerella acutata TaxID=27357 RepID=A0AAD8UCB9_GLOAC|nr:uncharacterized protein BDZ83DRAFT_635962 [Colletotrichum acutatum]KAK1715080.1 hypothetical protein BDZ83DRAFT_635962 [Colletotrichum acutatum]
MPAKRIVVQRDSQRSRQPKGYFRSTYDALTSSENAPIVRSVAIFGVSHHARPSHRSIELC